MEKVFIYYLSDIEGNIRYIGKTSQYTKQRLYSHIIECKTNRKSHKINWIKSLLNKGERPIIEVVDEVPEQEWQFWEEYWISQFRQWGFNLTNLTNGGQGGNGYRHTLYSKEKMRKYKLGGKLSEEQKKKISLSVKQKYVDNPNYNRNGNNTKTIIDKDVLYKLYIIENLSMSKISKKLGFSEKKIWQSIKEYDIIKPKENWIKQLSTHPKKVVLQYDLDGNLIKEWSGLQMIEDILFINKSNIANCCRGIANSAGGFIWRYRDNFIDIDFSKLKRVREVEQYSKNNEYINSFNSLKEASLATGVRNNNIQDCCAGRLKSAGGYIWKYKNN